ncbi:MAG: hypothetical protein P8Y39_03205 [Nitrospirota bacterium]
MSVSLKTERLRPVVAERVVPFFEELLEKEDGNIHSLHVVGSALTADFNEQTSDVNSVVVLKEMDLRFLEVLAPRGKKYRKRGVAAPLIMTPGYITASLDVFPVEFLSFRLIHETVYGEDVFALIEVDNGDLRQQCERELKTRLIGLRQGYISSLGDVRTLTETYVKAMRSYAPVFRGIIHLKGEAPPERYEDIVRELARVTGVDCDIFMRLLRGRHEKLKLSQEEVKTVFETYYRATEALGKVVDEIAL